MLNMPAFLCLFGISTPHIPIKIPQAIQECRISTMYKFQRTTICFNAVY